MPQVREVATAFNEMADRVNSLLDAQTMMTADVSHQLGTPLAALRLRLDLLGDELDEEQRREVNGMFAETSRLNRLVDDRPGMGTELREHAFDRIVTDRRGDGGTGLGLAIVG